MNWRAYLNNNVGMSRRSDIYFYSSGMIGYFQLLHDDNPVLQRFLSLTRSLPNVRPRAHSPEGDS